MCLPNSHLLVWWPRSEGDSTFFGMPVRLPQGSACSEGMSGLHLLVGVDGGRVM